MNARFYVGHYEARASQIADTNPATVPGAINLDNTAKFAPGKYEFVAVAPGQGHVAVQPAVSGPARPTRSNHVRAKGVFGVRCDGDR